MSLKMWYLKHFDKDKLLEELSKPVDGEYVVIKEGNMLTRVKKEELGMYIEDLKQKGEYYLNAYEKCIHEYGKELNHGNNVETKIQNK